MLLITVASAALLITLTIAAGYRLRALGRALAAEKASSRIAEAMRARDSEVLMNQREVLAAADRELDRALSLYAPNRDPNEGS